MNTRPGTVAGNAAATSRERAVRPLPPHRAAAGGGGGGGGGGTGRPPSRPPRCPGLRVAGALCPPYSPDTPRFSCEGRRSHHRRRGRAACGMVPTAAILEAATVSLSQPAASPRGAPAATSRPMRRSSVRCGSTRFSRNSTVVPAEGISRVTRSGAPPSSCLSRSIAALFQSCTLIPPALSLRRTEQDVSPSAVGVQEPLPQGRTKVGKP